LRLFTALIKSGEIKVLRWITKALTDDTTQSGICIACVVFVAAGVYAQFVDLINQKNSIFKS
jgi:hypothetical protein